MILCKDVRVKDMNNDEKIKKLITSGAEISGATIGGVLGFLAAGPVGAAIAGGGGVIISKALTRLGIEVKERILSPREEVRVGATISYVVEKIQENLSKGKVIRDDGFFEGEFDNRSAGDEVSEGLVLVAQRENQEKKIKYYGNLLANIAFNKDIDREFANLLITIAQNLSYRQLCLLNIFFKSSKLKSLQLRGGNYRAGGISKQIVPILYEIFDLDTKQLIVNSKNHVLGITDIILSEIELHGLGNLIYEIMELNDIPSNEIDELINILNCV